MTHSYSKLLFHLIWSTKNRTPLITSEIKPRLYGYIKTVIEDKKQKLIIINGIPNHVHLLVNLSANTCASDLIGHIKSNSTKWMKSNPINCKDFAWQEGFGAYSVGYSTMQSVIKYIENQEEHHKHISYDDEFLNFLKIQNIDYDDHFVLG